MQEKNAGNADAFPSILTRQKPKFASENRVRIISRRLSTGETEKLITNIYDESFTTNDFKKLYFKRWGIETKYSQLKSRYELENFSGCLPIAIEQDFYANIYLSNMLVLAKDEANEKVKKEKKNLKYEYKVNMNIFIGKMIPMLVCVFLEEDSDKRGKMYVKVMKSIEKNIVPIRPEGLSEILCKLQNDNIILSFLRDEIHLTGFHPLVAI